MAAVFDVYLNATPVGEIALLSGEISIFSFVESYQLAADRPTLSLGFAGMDGGLAYRPLPTKVRLHPFFSNLLPEGKLRQYVADKAGVHTDREFWLLGLAGDDLPGAVIVRPSGHALRSDECAVDGKAAQDEPIRFSLAGVQLKFSAVKKAKGGLTVPATGRGGSWIVKLPSELHEAVPENEAAMMEIAKAAGFEVPDFELVRMGDIAGLPDGVRKDGRAFMVKRFDRDGKSRIHIEDFAQIFRLYPDSKYMRISYRNIAEVIWRETGERGLREFVGRLVFNAAIGNGDMHAKNWSLIYRDGRSPEISPCYDFLSTLPYVKGAEAMALSLVGSKSFTDVDEARFIRLAEKAALPPEIVRSAAREAAERTAGAWADAREHLEVPRFVIDAVDRHMPSVPIMADAYRPRVRAG